MERVEAKEQQLKEKKRKKRKSIQWSFIQTKGERSFCQLDILST
jgi:hypothetical protein